MSFSLRRMLSNISYFSKPGEEGIHDHMPRESIEGNPIDIPTSENIEFDCVEADSTSKCTSLKFPKFGSNTSKKGSLSDTDILSMNRGKQDRKKCRKLKLDTEKASKSMSNSIYSEDSSVNLENTPKHKHLDCRSADYFTGFNFNQSFDISDTSVASSNEEIDIESLSDHSDSDISDIKMCRKVEHQSMPELLPSATPESFADVEIGKNEEERLTLLLNYQTKLENLDCFLKKLLTEFQFHIEVSKVFDSKSIVSAVSGNDIPKALDEETSDSQPSISPAWNIVMNKEDNTTKTKVKDQLLTMRQSIDEFIETHLDERKPKLQQSLTYDLFKAKPHRKSSLSYKKKIKHFDFPDLREAMINLFSAEDSSHDSDCSKCCCQCHSSGSQTPTSETIIPDQSITSSIGNFTLDSTTLSAYSESLDQIISYNSFETDSLYQTLLQKSAIERISFYIQVHSIQLKCEQDIESKNTMTFYCPTCKTTDYEENGLLKHILSPNHCEKIHFVYKSAYVKKCIRSGKEIQPSTILNSMTMYRDENKIVCFGDALYACSLCFENLIIGESVLISHCSEAEHVNRREMLADIFD